MERRRRQGSLETAREGARITALAFSPDGKQIASCSWILREGKGVIGIIEIADAQTGKIVKELEYGVKPIVAIAYSADGTRLAVGKLGGSGHRRDVGGR
ncbi:MAG: PD40 domain-containing protein [Acidobacteria bacterium]|nr:PD40 domain-containing protein [Acidobacteriota bacterium]